MIGHLELGLRIERACMLLLCVVGYPEASCLRDRTAWMGLDGRDKTEADLN